MTIYEYTKVHIILLYVVLCTHIVYFNNKYFMLIKISYPRLDFIFFIHFPPNYTLVKLQLEILTF
jgi:hypothetical protein